MKRAILAATLLLSISLTAPPAWPDDLSSQQMIQALQPKKKGLTRSLTGGSSGAVSPEDRQFIEGLKGATRSIVVEERSKLAAVVQKYDMPAFDMEIYFDFNSANIAAPAIGSLIKLGQALGDPSLAGQSIVISGHTDARGSDAYNQELSEARAQSVKSFLVENFQIDPRRLIAVGYGEEQLKDAAMPDADVNRRVSIVNIVM